MDDSYTLFFALGSILGTVAQLAVIIGCIVLVSKQKNAGTLLMLIGSILTLVFNILNFSGSLFAGHRGADSVLSWTKMFAVIGPLPYILFGIGLLVYAIGHVRKSA
ncbi:hypothetical protein [Flagellimonas flava]|uniref:hypothetical protein n=1 Tax=Flagellimonas flava TaxID=570519 RepID=UPI003D6521B7